MDWDPAFVDRSPMLEPFREHVAPLRLHRDWPTRDALQALFRARGVATTDGTPLRLVDDAGTEPYETRIRLRGEMHVRDRDWHDFFGALVWLTYPKTKAALNDALVFGYVSHTRAPKKSCQSRSRTCISPRSRIRVS